MKTIRVHGALFGVLAAATAAAAQAPSAKEVQAVRDKAIAYLKSSQGKDGSWSPKLAGPGITALVVAGLAGNGVAADDPTVARGLKYLESKVQPDGGIYDRFLANYVTAVSLMALKETNKGGRYDALLKKGAAFLKGIQTDENNADEKDVHFGGFGYDGKKRPDLSNTAFAVEALLAAGIPRDDPAIARALKFVGRCQNLPGEFNDQPWAKKASKEDAGGFVYNPTPGKDGRDVTPAGGLRSLGAMTYGGLKSFLYAGVDKSDPRVKAAVGWIRRHYTLEENPGLKKAGLFYYYHTFAKAMHALGEDPFTDAAGKKHAWRTELFEALRRQQRADGSWSNQGDRVFGEGNPDLATAFALLSLRYCRE